MKTCPKCGTEFDDEISLCPHCGAEYEAAHVDEPICDDEPMAEAYENDPGYVTPPPARKHDIKKIAIISGAAVLVVALVIALIFMLKPDPQEVVEDAYNKTSDQLTDIFANCNSFADLAAAIENTAEADKLSMSFNIVGEQLEIYEDGSELNFDISLNYDADMKDLLFFGDFSMNFSYDNFTDPVDTIGLSMLISGDKESIMFQMPGYFDGTYGIAIDENLIDRLIDSYIYRNTSLCQTVPAMMLRMLSAEFKSSYGALLEENAEDASTELDEAWVKLKGSFEYMSLSKDIPMLDGLNIYKVKYDKDAMSEFSDLFLDMIDSGEYVSVDEELYDLLVEITEAVKNGELKFYVGVDDEGNLAAVSVFSGSDYLSLVLSGKENIWNSFNLYIDNECVISGGFKHTNGGFQFRCSDSDDMGFVIAYNDKAGKLTLTVVSELFGEIELPLYLTAQSDGKGISVELDLSDLLGVSINSQVSTFDGNIKPLDTSFTDILDFTEDEFEQFMLMFADGINGGKLSAELGSNFTYENIFGDSGFDFY